MNRRPAVGIHKITIGGREFKIIVSLHLQGDTTAFLFKFQTPGQSAFPKKSQHILYHLMQFYDDVQGRDGQPLPPRWGIVDMANLALFTPVESVSWEK
jgi:hypothetical protein